MRYLPAQKLPVTPEILHSLCNICDQIGDLGTVLKVAFTLSYYGFLRQSNIAPPSPAAFDPSRHTTCADVTQQPPGLVVRLKWSKTHQVPVSRPSSPSLACRAIARTRWQHSCVRCMSSPPATQLTHCCYCLAGALSPAATSRGPSAAFSHPLASLHMRIRYMACAAAGQQPRWAQVLISWMWSAMACGRAMPSGST